MKRAKLRFDALKFDSSLEIIDKEGLLNAILGGSTSWDCVFNAFDYLDGSAYGWLNYYEQYMYTYGEDPTNVGGINTGYMGSVAEFGNMSIEELVTGSGIAINSTTGKTPDGRSIMMTFNGANGADHAVIVTGTSVVNGVTRINYYDPTTGLPGYRENGSYSAMYVGSSS